MFEIEDIVDLAGFIRATPIRNAFFTLSPMSAEQMQSFAVGPDAPRRIVLFKEGGRDVAYIRLVQQFWSPHPDLFAATISYLRDNKPVEMARRIIPVVESLATDLGANQLSTWVINETPELADELMALGYQSGQSNPITAADLTDFNADHYDPVIRKAEGAGYEFVDGHEFKRRHPEDYMRRLYNYDMAAMADVPMPTPFEGVPFELFVHDMEAPGQDFGLKIFALKGGEIAAGAGINRNVVDATIANVGLTATMRSHRRQGLATSVKALSMSRAKNLGIKTLITDNEESNPMLGLNLALGFKPVFVATEYSRTLA